MILYLVKFNMLQSNKETMEERFDKRFSMDERGVKVVGKDIGHGGHAMFHAESVKFFLRSEINLGINTKLDEVIREAEDRKIKSKNKVVNWETGEMDFTEIALVHNAALSSLIETVKKLKS